MSMLSIQNHYIAKGMAVVICPISDVVTDVAYNTTVMCILLYKFVDKWQRYNSTQQDSSPSSAQIVRTTRCCHNLQPCRKAHIQYKYVGIYCIGICFQQPACMRSLASLLLPTTLEQGIMKGMMCYSCYINTLQHALATEDLNAEPAIGLLIPCCC